MTAKEGSENHFGVWERLQSTGTTELIDNGGSTKNSVYKEQSNKLI